MLGSLFEEKNPPPHPEILKNPQKTLPRPPKTLKKPSPETFLKVLAPENVTKGGRARPPLVAFEGQNS